MAKQEYTLEYTLKTYCKACGLALAIQGMTVIPEPRHFRDQRMHAMKTLNAGEQKCPRCNKVQPKVPEAWVAMFGDFGFSPQQEVSKDD